MSNEAKKISRNDLGLIDGIEYFFTEEGRVDWKKMIPTQFLFINNDAKRKDGLEKKYGKPLKEIDPIKDSVEDRDLVIMLGGLKHLLRLRGFKSVTMTVNTSSEFYSSVTCTIVFSGNYETEFEEQIYSDTGSAHLHSTESFTRAYLVEMATNRAFARAIRNYLNLNIVSKEELGGDGIVEKDNKPLISTANELLIKKCNEKNFSFEKVKEAATRYSSELESDPNSWTSWEAIPPKDCYTLLTKIKSKS